MHEHDQDLIMALAEGALDEAAAAAATSAIGACPECTRDLELQRIALSALDDLPAVYLTATESSRLHANLHRGLRLGDPSARARRSTGFAWGRWLPAVGIAAVLLVVIVSLPFLTGGDSDSSNGSDTAAMEMTTTAAATETTAAASAPRAAYDAAGSAESLEVAGDGATTAQEMAETTTTAAAETTVTTNSEQKNAFDMLSFLGMIGDLNRDSLVDRLVDDIDMVQETSLAAREADSTVNDCLVTNASPEIATQLGLPEKSEPVLLGVVADAATGEEFLLVAYVAEDINETVFVTQRNHSCDIVATLFQ
jgi:hypothetical protein